MPPPTVLLMSTLMLFLNSCAGREGGSEGHLFEQMAIFSLIAFTIFAVGYISLAGRKERSEEFQSREDLIRTAPILPFTSTELTGYPVYVRDSRTSFHKLVFDPGGTLLESRSTTENGIDPAVVSAGTWELSSGGNVRITRAGTGAAGTYARISTEYFPAVLIRADSGQLEAWYIGRYGLADIQASIFGYSASVESAAKFTSTLVSGRTVHRSTYPGISVNDSGEVKFDPEAVCGMITFNAEGTLRKSIDSKIGPAPDYSPSIAGVWNVDEKSGILMMTVYGYTVKATILFHYIDLNILLVNTTNGTERWKLQG